MGTSNLFPGVGVCPHFLARETVLGVACPMKQETATTSTKHLGVEQALQNGRNWLLTVFLYLQSPKRGGETYFPSTYGKPLPTELGKCDGPSVTPPVWLFV